MTDIAPGVISYQIVIENRPVGITVRKTDENGNPLSGSKFVLYKKSESGSFEPVTEYGLEENGAIDLSNTSEKTFSGLPNGLYKLMETIAPDGYIINTKNIYFSISGGSLTLTDDSGNETVYTHAALADENTTVVVKNTSGTALPSTGGPTASPFLITGAALTTTATVLSLRELKLRRREQE